MSQNHVDGEIWVNEPGKLQPSQMPQITRVPVEPTDLEYRTAALNAAVAYFSRPDRDGDVVWKAEYFEKYLRGEAA